MYFVAFVVGIGFFIAGLAACIGSVLMLVFLDFTIHDPEPYLTAIAGILMLGFFFAFMTMSELGGLIKGLIKSIE